MVEAQTSRAQGWEWRAARWAARHPGVMSVPAGLGTCLVEFGPQTVGISAAAAAVGAVGWYRGHPATWDRWVAPRLRSWRRRWLSRSYCGKWWLDNIAACKLMEHHPDGNPNPPRVVRIRSHSPSCETVWVKLPKGQTLQAWKEAGEALTMALGAERITIELVSRKRRVIALVVQRNNPFDETIIAPAPATNADMVDLASVYLGITEYGTAWAAPIVGQHWLVSGAMGSGKSSIVWCLLRAVAPLVRDGIVRLWVGDPKEVELAPCKPVAYRYATATQDIWAMIDAFWDTMQERKKQLSDQGVRKFTPSRETPLDLLIIDELAAVVAYGGSPKELRDIERTLSLILTQGRALGGSVVGAVQEPTKDVVGMRELFTWRAQLRATSAQHPDMVLGEDARIKGALADEIPNTSETAGVGYVMQQRTRTPLNVRAAYVDDNAINDIITVAGWPMTELHKAQTEASDTTTETKEEADARGEQ